MGAAFGIPAPAAGTCGFGPSVRSAPAPDAFAGRGLRDRAAEVGEHAMSLFRFAVQLAAKLAGAGRPWPGTPGATAGRCDLIVLPDPAAGLVDGFGHAQVILPAPEQQHSHAPPPE
jgi:hypothetical protein